MSAPLRVWGGGCLHAEEVEGASADQVGQVLYPGSPPQQTRLPPPLEQHVPLEAQREGASATQSCWRWSRSTRVSRYANWPAANSSSVTLPLLTGATAANVAGRWDRHSCTQSAQDRTSATTLSAPAKWRMSLVYSARRKSAAVVLLTRHLPVCKEQRLGACGRSAHGAGSISALT